MIYIYVKIKKMKKYITTIAFTFIGLVLFAQKPEEKSLLWEISGKDLKQPSYLYGTFHLICPEDLVITPAIEKAIGVSESMFLELDMDDPTLASKMQGGMLMKDGHKMSEYLSPETFANIDKALQAKIGAPAAAVDNYKPMLLLSMIYPSVMQCTPASWELELMKIALGQKKEVYGLETIESQFEVFDSIPYAMQSRLFSEYLLDENKMADETNKMLDLYRKKDINGLYKMIKETEYSQGNLENLLLGNRNENWIPQIIAQSKKATTFYAVGAAHLAGEKGLLELLRKGGYTVKPIQ